jgi:hypothetical protein
MSYFENLAKDKITKPAIANRFNRLEPDKKTVWLLHTAFWETLREFVEADTKRWGGNAMQAGLDVVTDYKRKFFNEDTGSPDWVNRDTKIADYPGGAEAIAGRIKRELGDLLEEYDAFKKKFVGKDANVSFKSGAALFTGTIKVEPATFGNFYSSLQQVDTVLGIFSNNPIEFVPATGMGNRGLKLKGNYVEVSTGAQTRLWGTPTGTFGRAGYKIVFNEIGAGH